MFTDEDTELTTEDFRRACRIFREYQAKVEPLFTKSGVILFQGMRHVVLADAEGWLGIIGLDGPDDCFGVSIEDLLANPDLIVEVNSTYGPWLWDKALILLNGSQYVRKQYEPGPVRSPTKKLRKKAARA